MNGSNSDSLTHSKKESRIAQVTLRNPAAYKANDARWKTIAIEALRCERFSGFHRGKEEFYGRGGVVSHLYVTSDTTIYIGKCVSGASLQSPH
jgi:hypothetical protein